MSAIYFINRYFHPDHSATSQMLSDLAFDLAALGHDVRVIRSRQIYDEPQARLRARAGEWRAGASRGDLSIPMSSSISSISWQKTSPRWTPNVDCSSLTTPVGTKLKD
jgi:hypothetical protein